MPCDGWAKRNRLQNSRLKSTGETPAMLIGVTVPNIGPLALTGEAVEIALDPGGGAHQDYVEDCEVCCQPWRVSVQYGIDGGAEVEVTALGE